MELPSPKIFSAAYVLLFLWTISTVRGTSTENRETRIDLVQCEADEIACDNGRGCYNATSACDGTVNCQDSSDEKPAYCAPACGVSHIPILDHASERITGGIVANRHSLPWQVALFETTESRYKDHFCGGTIIRDRWILTAAHCLALNPRAKWSPTGPVNWAPNEPVSYPSPENITVRVGAHDLSALLSVEKAVDLEVNSVHCHPMYHQQTPWDYDFCLLKLKEVIPFRKNIAPACLPTRGEDVSPNTQCLISGWGRTGLGQATSSVLQQVTKPVLSRLTTCNTTENGFPQFEGAITDRMLCTGNVQGIIIPIGSDSFVPAGSCPGDSGGPMMCKTKGATAWTVSGVVSWGTLCRDEPLVGIPPISVDIYARTGYVVDWIETTIAQQDEFDSTPGSAAPTAPISMSTIAPTTERGVGTTTPATSAVQRLSMSSIVLVLTSFSFMKCPLF
ncbi:putative Transmembrane protease serine 9 [Hypsibius exemplaris]|uniref:Transmembrane protease serine 9 n=1 Tax=Hypsibius exemplaris TaxID=2072580 RepID=A0A1W0W9A0_HYPEX|nr:putative Transmembrane protease serine 9 [Hypsibius exemplaris]